MPKWGKVILGAAEAGLGVATGNPLLAAQGGATAVGGSLQSKKAAVPPAPRAGTATQPTPYASPGQKSSITPRTAPPYPTLATSYDQAKQQNATRMGDLYGYTPATPQNMGTE